ncbi:ABC transporter ATP-binding protein [Aliicoccus persicus]|uniref:Iron complex transport system ATP-binding protein n=1 Tax=Aliicoccus persicus TaxID=930138 RepID=A0A662Z412_9STAP|nr:ABC transporter ATP-binding protein [Aliicoccus persicus]SEW07996.1 iron complex transport system ATP-binding protein [Aliicoccus persicus]
MLEINQLYMQLPNMSIKLENAVLKPGLHVIIGPNGAGKTTLLHGIIGYGQQIKNRGILYNKRKLNDTSDVISFMPQENPRFGIHVDEYLRLTGNSNDASQSIARFSLEEFLDQPITTLSGGEFKRVLCAQVHHENKPVILADEIEAHLDINQKYLVMDWLKEEAKTKIVIASIHDLSLAMTYADSVTLMHDGNFIELTQDKNKLSEDKLSYAFNTSLKIRDVDGRLMVIRR